MNQSTEDKKAPEQKAGNGYEYDCEPREFTEAAKAQWKKGRPPEFDALPDFKPSANPE